MKTAWERDPFFQPEPESEEPPFVSPVVQSKLAIRAVLSGDLGDLKSLRDDRDKVHSLKVRRSLAIGMSAVDYALKAGDLAALRVLLAEEPEGVKPRVMQPVSRYVGRINYFVMLRVDRIYRVEIGI